MKKNTSQNKNRLQRLKYYKPLFPISVKKKISWRVRSYEIKITKKKQFYVKFRSFKTSPNNRSKKSKQFVFNPRFLKTKEIAISYKIKTSKNKKLAKTSRKEVFIKRLSTSLMIFGSVGLIIFVLQISGVGQTDPPLVTAQSVTEDSPRVKSDTAPIKELYLTKSTPTHIDIPSISVNSDIVQVGLLSSGALETPSVLSNLVGWYKYSPTPGEQGPSVLVGHVDSYKGPSVFWNLGKLNAGDAINISREDGTLVKYKVINKVQYDQDNFGTEEVYGNIDYAGLRIITCGGTFNHITGHYSHNTVVFAKLDI